MGGRLRSLAQRVYAQPYLLLGFTMLMWAANAVASRMAVGQISPMALTAGRWGLVLATVVLFARRAIVRGAPVVLPQWRAILLMAIAGYTVNNACFYLSAHFTSAVNMSILQGSLPVFVMLGALVAHRTPVRLGQGIGMVLALAGVLTVTTQGHLEHLMDLKLNPGDLLVVGACVLYAGFALALRGRPGASSIAFFAGLAASALVTSLPLLVVETLRGATYWPTLQGWAVLVYIALAPSFVAQLSFLRAVELIGPARAGPFVNLVPVFGALMAVLMLGEEFRLYHAAALVLVLAGIYLAERAARPAAAAAA